jgi:hypothetical protein
LRRARSGRIAGRADRLRLGTGEDAEVIVLRPDAVRPFARTLAELASSRVVTIAPSMPN